MFGLRDVRRAAVCLLGALLVGWAAVEAQEPGGKPEFSPDQLEFFEKRVRPIFVEHCHECHAGDKVKGGLSLTSRARALQGGDSGAAVVPGDVSTGELLAALAYDPAGYQMPPAGKLADEHIAAIKKWIEMGAPWPVGDAAGETAVGDFDLAGRAQHWSFQPLTKPAVPDVEQVGWCRNPVDRFLLSQLEAEQLLPAVEADRRTWLRRVHFDVAGLPPTREETQVYLADDQPGAEDRVVERLLSSPHFGERWGRHWLDLVRYAESRGHEFDYHVANPWHYRDYVIRALNDDVPYHQFLTEHVAGDLLVEGGSSVTRVGSPALRLDPVSGRNESILGTGFWFLGEWVHSPVDIRQEEADRFDNMIDVYAKTFLGLTVACARCHDHKFDPILQQDFYALQGYLQSSTYRQARFETMNQERRIGEELVALRKEAGPALLRMFAELAEPTANDADKYFLAAQAILEEGVELKAAADERVFADFETGTYAGWTTTGDAFGTGPQTLATIPDYQGKINLVGTYFVNSHQTREGGGGDRPTGTLTSDLFTIEHRYIRLLVGGGSHAKRTCVQLLVEEQPVRTVTGKNSNQMFLAQWAVEDLRGQSARIQVVDAEQGGWGNIGLDHVVFSNQPVDGPPRVTPGDFAPEMQQRLVKGAREYGVHVGTLSHWVAELASTDAADGLPARFISAIGSGSEIQLVSAESAEQVEAPLEQFLRQEQVELVTDFRSAVGLITDGPVFQTGQRRTGDPILTLAGIQPVAGVEDLGGVSRDRFWDGLKVAAGTIGDPGSTANWQRGGRMLQTDAFEIRQPKLYALVQGGCRSYACVDSHITIVGPLHGSLSKDHAAQSGWHWIEHDLSRYEGHRAHLEFIPKDEDDFTVAIVVQAPANVPLPAVDFKVQRTTGKTSSARADQLRLLVEAAIHLMYGDSTVSSSDPELVTAVNWLLQHPRLVGMDDENLARWNQLAQPYRERFVALQQQSQLESHTAPCLLAGTPEDEYIFVRGNWKKRGNVAPREFLTVFRKTAGESGAVALDPAIGTSRLDLAMQMIDPQQTPIVARVIVNRIWLHYFGRGIVPTPDDFGHLGQTPSHPELLDWLACEFVEHGWSQKHIHQLILGSAAYRMSSTLSTDPRVATVDPDNVLLHRMNMKRLEGEVIRDGILAISGGQDARLYGPSIPIHLNDFLEGRGRPESGPVDGSGRRSIYLSVRRNFLEPFFQAFDFPVPHTTTGRRSVSNVPAQALAMMNNEMVLDQSQVWAAKLLREHAEIADRVDALYEQAYGRPPTATDREQAQQFLAAQASEYGTSPEDIRVWTDLCQVLWNAKEFVFVR